MQAPVELVEDPRQVGALAHPVRARLLDALRSPDTAAGLARRFGRSRQLVGYHLKELERVGLVRRTAQRRKGHLVEQLYQAVARRFLVSARFAADRERLGRLLHDQVSLARLADLGERVQHDAAALIERASGDGAPVPSASVEAELRFADEASRTRFLAEYVEALNALLAKYDAAEGEPYRVALAAYPQPEDDA